MSLKQKPEPLPKTRIGKAQRDVKYEMYTMYSIINEDNPPAEFTKKICKDYIEAEASRRLLEEDLEKADKKINTQQAVLTCLFIALVVAILMKHVL